MSEEVLNGIKLCTEVRIQTHISRNKDDPAEPHLFPPTACAMTTTPLILWAVSKLPTHTLAIRVFFSSTGVRNMSTTLSALKYATSPYTVWGGLSSIKQNKLQIPLLYILKINC
jgi:hypothetical protein